MSPESFCYWLNGLFELSDVQELTPKQVEIIKEHLALVFNKVTSSKTRFCVNTIDDNVCNTKNTPESLFGFLKPFADSAPSEEHITDPHNTVC
ncbi:MAG: hypothetical protein R3213_10430 [Flavobacteriaceae bacterium]|nr:hypothetical protein [Flavobacteriaceae bacterium]